MDQINQKYPVKGNSSKKLKDAQRQHLNFKD